MSADLNQAALFDGRIFEMAPIGMAISRLDGTLIDANKSFVQTIGYSKNELMGMTYMDLTHPDDLEENLRRNNLLIEGKMHEHQMEKRFITKDGRELNTILKVSLMHDEDKKPAYLIAQILDITDKINLLSEIESSERKFREIFEDAAIPMAQATLEGEIFNINKAFTDLLEYSSDELKGSQISDISHPDDMVVNRRKSEKLIDRNGINYSMEKRYQSKSGKVIYALLKVSYIKGAPPNPPHLLGQIVDITSIKNYEQLLESNNMALQKVNSELDTFIYRASHDLRGPLATMKGLVSLIEANNPDDNVVIDGMSSSIEKLENVIRKLVAFSRNTQSTVDKKEIKIRKIIEESLQLYEFHENFDLAEITINVADDLSFSTDVSRIKPIFNNLISNSLTYLDCAKSRCTLSITCRSENDFLLIEVEDNGEGMTTESVNRAFEMFYRGSEKSTGSGLGLYLVNEIVSKLEGKINISSRPGMGTKVVVSLPA